MANIRLVIGYAGSLNVLYYERAPWQIEYLIQI